ncbi:MAG: MFS transporter [Kiritimatiellae bacterium]|nr:MFS transporter [Kiritimatiellia bacterium]
MDKRAVNAWCLYDWANSAFATTIMAAVFPPFYRALGGQAGLSGSEATAYWGYTAAVGLLVVALIAPVLGAIADYTGGRKRYTAVFLVLGILCTAALARLRCGGWLAASVLFVGGNLGFAGANVFYESLLPHIAGQDEIDRVSAKGYALGYVGGGILLAVNLLWIARPAAFGLPSADAAVRLSFLSVAVWWGVFSVPLFRRVPEPPAGRTGETPGRPLRQGLLRLAATFRQIRRHRQLLLFLAAFWIYNDGIGTIIKMATAYGDEMGIGLTHMVWALVITQFVGIPFTFLFGALGERLGAKRGILIALGVYTLISVLGCFMRTAAHFYVLAVLVGTVQGGSQALSRSLFGAMVPKQKSAEFFGFFSTSAKLAGIAGPLLFAFVSHLTGASRLSILALIAFFGAGALVLSRVDAQAGIRAARAE